MRKRERLYDIAVRWDKPILKPDNYTLQLDSFQFESQLLVVSGVSIIIEMILIKKNFTQILICFL